MRAVEAPHGGQRIVLGGGDLQIAVQRQAGTIQGHEQDVGLGQLEGRGATLAGGIQALLGDQVAAQLRVQSAGTVGVIQLAPAADGVAEGRRGFLQTPRAQVDVAQHVVGARTDRAAAPGVRHVLEQRRRLVVLALGDQVIGLGDADRALGLVDLGLGHQCGQALGGLLVAAQPGQAAAAQQVGAEGVLAGGFGGQYAVQAGLGAGEVAQLPQALGVHAPDFAGVGSRRRRGQVARELVPGLFPALELEAVPSAHPRHLAPETALGKLVGQGAEEAVRAGHIADQHVVQGLQEEGLLLVFGVGKILEEQVELLDRHPVGAKAVIGLRHQEEGVVGQARARVLVEDDLALADGLLVVADLLGGGLGDVLALLLQVLADQFGLLEGAAGVEEGVVLGAAAQDERQQEDAAGGGARRPGETQSARGPRHDHLRGERPEGRPAGARITSR